MTPQAFHKLKINDVVRHTIGLDTWLLRVHAVGLVTFLFETLEGTNSRGRLVETDRRQSRRDAARYTKETK